jgi:uncharacterized membrane protein
MDFASGYQLIFIAALATPALFGLWWFSRRTTHPMSDRRRLALLIVRIALVVFAAIALMHPAVESRTTQQAVIFVLDHSRSQGRSGMVKAYDAANRLASALPDGTVVGFISAGANPELLRLPEAGHEPLEPDLTLAAESGQDSNYQAALELARDLFPHGTTRRIVVVGDAMQTKGDLLGAVNEAVLGDVVVDVVPVAGEALKDVRVLRMRASRSSLHQGAEVALYADIESSLEGKGVARLFENGIEVDRQELELKVGETKELKFKRAPDRRNLYDYRVVVEGFGEDAIADNNEGLTYVDVKGRPMFLYIEGEKGEAHYLADAMRDEGIDLDVRPPEGIPPDIRELGGYDGVILSDVPRQMVGDEKMVLMRKYVEFYGGGFLMIGGRNSFGVGGYYHTPIEEILPVKMKSPDTEEKYAVALSLVIDRSGSMSGQKIEIAKSASIGTLDLLTRKDYLSVVAFDSSAHQVVPITRIGSTSKQALMSRISTINAGGGTNIYPGMQLGHADLGSVRAKVKHMIVMTDGQSEGSGYPQLAAQMQSEGITISTVAVGGGADVALLRSVAAAGGGTFYFAQDASQIPQIFTQDTMVHVNRMIREEVFKPLKQESHSAIEGWAVESVPQLLGYVKTRPKAGVFVPLVTDLGDPLLALRPYGLGKVAAFTSDCKSRWAATWLTDGHDIYRQFWAQVLREIARERQGQRIDIRVDRKGSDATVVVDLMADAATFYNNAQVEATVRFLPATMRLKEEEPVYIHMDQVGPGRYEGQFRLDRPGVYLVRAEHNKETVSAGVVQTTAGEAATGQINEPLIEQVVELSGGQRIDPASEALPDYDRRSHSHYYELRPVLLALILLLFMADIVIRRWENVLGMTEYFRTVTKGRS